MDEFEELSRDERIRAIAIEAASHLYSDRVYPGSSQSLTLAAAQKFEAYIKGGAYPPEMRHYAPTDIEDEDSPNG